MPFLDQLGRSISTFIGITPPPPEQERRFGILILIATVVMALGTLALLVFMTRAML
jgi:hypothetical protein